MSQSTYKLIVTLLVLVILVGGSMLLYRELSPQVDLGEPAPSQEAADLAPDVTIVDAGGKEVTLSDFRGRGVVLNFWASWCGPCKQEMPHFQEAYETYGDDLHFVMVNMSTAFGDSREAAAQVLEEGGYTFPVYYDDLSECAYGYGVNGIPVTIFIDAEGKIVSSRVGMMNEADLERRILTILD